MKKGALMGAGAPLAHRAVAQSVTNLSLWTLCRAALKDIPPPLCALVYCLTLKDKNIFPV